VAGLLRDAQLVWKLMSDPRVSLATKVAVPLVAGLYLLSPIDLLPDLAPILGQMDDLAVLALAIKLFIQLAPAGVVEQIRQQMAQGGPGQATRNRYETVDAEYRVID
jgi:uncharacterized membrane protein YkvA (DUF1232 family)